MNLVTGATGLLGSHIVEQLCRFNRPVRAVVRRTRDISWLQTMPVEIVYGDVTDRKSIDEAMRGVEYVYHYAARVGDWGPWQEFEDTTIIGTKNVLETAEAAGVKRFLHKVYCWPPGRFALAQKAKLPKKHEIAENVKKYIKKINYLLTVTHLNQAENTTFRC